MAKAGVEMAMWELGAQMEGVPLSKYLGGTREKIGTGVSLGIQESPAKLVENVVFPVPPFSPNTATITFFSRLLWPALEGLLAV